MRTLCVGAGARLRQFADSNDGTIIYRENVRGLIAPDDMQVPHSELAIQTRAAGHRIIAWACAEHGNACAAVVETASGCDFIAGTTSEVLPIRMRESLRRNFQKNLSGLRVTRRRSR